MKKIKKVKFLLLMLMVIPSTGLCQDTAVKSPAVVHYFIDTDCENCVVKGQEGSSFWVSTKQTYIGNWKDRDALIKAFREKLSDLPGSDSVLFKRIVFRYQDTAEEALNSFVGKENKMKARGYKVIKIDFK